MVFEFIYAFGILLVVCELSERIVNAFGELSGVIDQCDWHLYPVEIQKLLPFLIMNTSKPIAIEYFGSLTCSRSSFKKVSRAKTLAICNLMLL